MGGSEVPEDSEASEMAFALRRSFGEDTSTICVCGDNQGRVHILMSNGLETTPKDYDRRNGPHMHFKLHHVSHHVEQLHAFDPATVVRRAKEADLAHFIMGATERHAAIRVSRHCHCAAPRNQRHPTTVSAQFVPRIGFLAIDCAMAPGPHPSLHRAVFGSLLTPS